jgi:hypothetical protein
MLRSPLAVSAFFPSCHFSLLSPGCLLNLICFLPFLVRISLWLRCISVKVLRIPQFVAAQKEGHPSAPLNFLLRSRKKSLLLHMSRQQHHLSLLREAEKGRRQRPTKEEARNKRQPKNVRLNSCLNTLLEYFLLFLMELGRFHVTSASFLMLPLFFLPFPFFALHYLGVFFFSHPQNEFLQFRTALLKNVVFTLQLLHTTEASKNNKSMRKKTTLKREKKHKRRKETKV